MKPATGKFAAWLLISTAQLALLAITVLRLLTTRQSVLGADECLGCQAATLVQHEAGLWALAWLLLVLVSVTVRPIRVVAAALLWGLILILAADVVTLQQFGLRLYLADIVKYGQQPRFIVDYLQDLAGWLWVPMALLAVVALPWLTVVVARRHLASNAARTGLLAMFGFSLLVYALPDRAAHPLPWTYQNLLEANWPTGVDRPFSKPYLERLMADPPESLGTRRCVPGLGLGGDVIIVAIESLSWYHSALILPESLEATPNLDAAARKNSWWDQFLANGFTTDHGLIAMLADQLPVPAVNRYRSIDVFAGYEVGPQALPRRLGEDGYHTAFITSGDLGFLGKGAWLRELGFDHIEGHDQADYAGARRFGFSAVSDDLLYRRVLDWLQHERPPSQPVVAFVETVSTHPPFTDPESGKPDETATFRFADRALADFIQALQERGFFRKGLLIITSDQRALTPIRASELEAFGPQAGARLPLIMLGDRIPLQGRQTAPAQMRDLPFSLDYYLTDEACHLPGQGNLFTGQAPDCIYQPDGNQRSIIHAFCGADSARIRMEGDQTRVIDGHLPDEERRVRELNYLRGRLGAQEVNMHRVL